MLIQLLNLTQEILSGAIEIYSILLIVYFLMSWIPGAYQSKLGYFLMRICEPFVGFFRRFLPPVGMVSFAGMAAYFSLMLVQGGLNVVFNLLRSLAYAL